MAATIRWVSAVSLCMTLLATAAPEKACPQPPGASQSIAQSVFYPEVRLRKLHLVRPDLIPYPIYFDIYC